MFLTLLLFSLMLSLFSQPLHHVILPIVPRVTYWLGSLYLVNFFWVLQFRMLAGLNFTSRRRIPAHSGVMCFCGLAAMLWLTYWFGLWLGIGRPLAAHVIWAEVLRYTVMAVMMDVFISAMVLPGFRYVRFDRLRPHDTPAPLPPADTPEPPLAVTPEKPRISDLTVNGRRIPLNALRYMKSVEHYVEFVLDTEVLTERCTLRDLVAQTGAEDGIQPHRSYWVSRREISRLGRRDGNAVLILKDGTEIPLSRHRKTEVAAWLDHAATDRSQA